MALSAAVAAVLLLVLLAVPRVAAADEEPLRIILSAPETCEIDADAGAVAPTLQIGWDVRGGIPPYRIHVHGRHQEEPVGSDLALCGIWEGRDVGSGQMPILGRVTDATGASASALAYTQAVRVIRADASPNERIIGLQPGETYLIHGLLLTMPDDRGFGLGPYVAHRCAPGAAVCGDEFPLYLDGNSYGSTLWLRRWHHDESRRVIAEGDDAERINAVFDRLVASIGQAPERPRLSAGLSATDSPELELELQAPEICETYWGRYGGARQAIQAEWRVRGGTAPYQVQFADQMLKGERGAVSLPCGLQRDDADGVDSQLMNTQAVVIDAQGNVSSAVVSTYVIAANRYGGSELRSGWTHRVQGLLMTVPDDIIFHVESFGHVFVDCEPDEEEEESEPEEAATARQADSSSRTSATRDSYLYRCQNRWSMDGEWRIGDLSGTLWVAFGETTKDVVDHGVKLQESSQGAAGSARTLAEVNQRIESFAASVGQPPRLPKVGLFNPAPLRIRAWPEPLVCGPVNSWDQMRSAQAQRRVAGGRWWPLGVGDEAWNDDLRSAQVICGAGWGEYSNPLETHESGPDPAQAEALVTHYAVPVFGDREVLVPYGAGWVTSYCEPGGARTVTWNVQGGTGPYQARVNGLAAEMSYDAEFRSGDGWFEVICAKRLGLQAMMVEVWDSAETPNRVVFPILLMAVEEHPSGRPWTEFE